MTTSYETIYHQALQSDNPKSILTIADVIDRMGQPIAAQKLREHAEYLIYHRAWPIAADTMFGVDHLIYSQATRPIPFRGFSVMVGVDVAAIQARLNALGANPPLTVDGVSGPKTEAAVKAFQASHNIEADGVVGPITLAALGMGETSESSGIVPSSSSGIAAVRGLEKKGDTFKNKLVEVANALGINPDWLATVISFETGGTFSPSIQNPYSNATGLIQFMPSTAKGLQTTIDALKSMTDVQQLDYVYKYLSAWKGRMHNLDDVYLAIFMPTQMGKSSSSVVASEGSKVYEQNSGFDRDKKGYFTVGDITSAVRGVYNAGINRGKIPVSVAIAGGGIGLGAIVGIGVGIYLLLKKKRS
jgi:peptidoglycan hydrolase-like protein with peptidoglycan-binding domain